MKALGLRAHPHHVCFVILASPAAEGSVPVVQLMSTLRLPVALHTPERLAYLRTALMDLIREFGVTYAGIRTTEPVSRNLSIERVHVEGVIQELLGAGAVPHYVAGALAPLGHLLGITVRTAKQLVDGELPLAVGPTENTRMSKEHREAVLAALAAMRIPRSRLGTLGAELSASAASPEGADAD